jgi:hypothetical protein
MSRATTRRSTSAAALLALAACSYTYKNPAESLGGGEVGGRTVADGGVLDGVSVSLKGAALDAQSRASGRFAMLPLPAGRHTLLFRKATERALQLQIDLGYGKDGRPQGFWLGDVAVPPASALAGTLAGPSGVVLATDAGVVDEATGTSALATDGVTYTLAGLSTGEHRLYGHAADAAGNVYVGGPRAVTIVPDDAGTVRTLGSPLELHLATADTATVIVQVKVIGVSLAGSHLSLVGFPLAAQPALDSTGLAQAEVREGRWTVGVTLTPAVAGVALPPPVSFVAVAGATLDLGTLYVVGNDSQRLAALACHSHDDCAPGGSCAGGSCAGWTPPAAASATAGLCEPSTLGCAAGPRPGSPVPAVCVAGSFAGGTAAVACGTCCSPDGVATICGEPGVGGCPALGGP